MRRSAIALLTVLLGLEACGAAARIAGRAEPAADGRYGAGQSDYQVYFDAFDNPWVGREVAVLVATLGPPDAILEARPRGGDFEAGIHALSYIYNPGFESAAVCIDVYVVAEASGTIIKYYCR